MILVNVFGGIVNCATIASGIIEACRITSLDLPVVVRLEGTYVSCLLQQHAQFFPFKIVWFVCFDKNLLIFTNVVFRLVQKRTM